MSTPDQREKSPSNSTKELKKNNKLFITNLCFPTNRNDLQNKLKTLFSKYGDIVDLQCKQNSIKKYAYAFLEMKDYETITKILQQLNGTQFQGRNLRIQYQKSNPRQREPYQKKPNNNYNSNRSKRFQRRDFKKRSETPPIRRRSRLSSSSERESPKRKKHHSKRHYDNSSSQDHIPRYDRKDYSSKKEKSNKQRYEIQEPSRYDKNPRYQARNKQSERLPEEDNKYRKDRNFTQDNHREDPKTFSTGKKRQRSNSREPYYMKGKDQLNPKKETKQNPDQSKEISSKRSRDNRKKRNYSPSSSSDSSYHRQRQQRRRSDKKGKHKRRSSRSYSPYSRRNYK